MQYVAQTKIFEHYFIPSRKKSKKLIVVLHGRGDSLVPFKNFQNELKLYDYNFLLLNAHRKFLTGRSWYPEPPAKLEGIKKIRSQLFVLMNELEQQGWSHSQIVLLGFSQGALISADFGLHYPKSLGGIICVSGYFQFFPRWRQNLQPQMKKTPWLLTHGTKDDVLPYDITLFGAKKIKSAGFDLEWIRFEKKHRMEEEEYPYFRDWLRHHLG